MPAMQGIKSAVAQEAYPTEIKITFGSKEEFDNFALLLRSGRGQYYTDSQAHKQATQYLQALGK